MASNDTTQAIQSYVTDMLALEKHISKAFQAQIEDLEDYPTVVTQLRTLHATTAKQIHLLTQACFCNLLSEHLLIWAVANEITSNGNSTFHQQSTRFNQICLAFYFVQSTCTKNIEYF
jgi:hypothetical protein